MFHRDLKRMCFLCCLLHSLIFCRLRQVCSSFIQIFLFLLILSAYNINYWERLIQFQTVIVSLSVSSSWSPGIPSLLLTLDDPFQWDHRLLSLPPYCGRSLLCFSKMSVFPSPVYFPVLWYERCPLGYGEGERAGFRRRGCLSQSHIVLYINILSFLNFRFLPLNSVKGYQIAQLHPA